MFCIVVHTACTKGDKSQLRVPRVSSVKTLVFYCQSKCHFDWQLISCVLIYLAIVRLYCKLNKQLYNTCVEYCGGNDCQYTGPKHVVVYPMYYSVRKYTVVFWPYSIKSFSQHTFICLIIISGYMFRPCILAIVRLYCKLNKQLYNTCVGYCGGTRSC